MDIGTYREFLGRFDEALAACGGQFSRVSHKWVAEFDRNFSSDVDKHLLNLHLAQVRRSAEALALLAQESVSPLSTSTTEIERAAANLLSETQRLQELLRRIGAVSRDLGVVGLVGEFLSSVVFVMDYIQLDFNGSSITSYSWPVIVGKNEKFSLADPGYRDMLCRLMGASVSEVALTTEELILRFASGILLTISLRPEDVNGPEIASFISETGLLWV